ncbi:serine/threonine protein kinase [Gaeumannomyces tritici R3-111a-1]|uniref:Serine/threonine protein kinase n=1 Tax=Gaeumannomyces tritici (strain R3-111a-1) TaxID=644352 RepID=J3NQL7_GAET3|nr:serine/threonine protein kinase [Gaeumannomyces tritici R3-111a-1]EJT78473.1 serine/threonine protein kinase [Gaeumannomyces tritici R3-111a-1]
MPHRSQQPPNPTIAVHLAPDPPGQGPQRPFGTVGSLHRGGLRTPPPPGDESDDPSDKQSDYLSDNPGDDSSESSYSSNNGSSDSLTMIIRRSRIPSSYKPRADGYLPFAVLRRHMTNDRIRKALREECEIAEKEQVEQFCAQIVPAGLANSPKRWCVGAPESGGSHLGTPAGYLTVFALLLEIERGDLIGHFIDQGFSDHQLPLGTKLGPNRSVQLAEIRKPDAVAKSCWLRHTDVKSLREEQWSFFTPFFECEQDGTPKHYDLPTEAQLPWRQTGKDDRKKWPTSDVGHCQGSWGRQGDPGAEALAGGFGTVELVIIDPDSHGFHHLLKQLSLPNKWFAIKSLLKADVVKYKKEIDNLKRFSGRNHENLVTLLATFTHRDKFNLIFPCADGDLEHYWRRLRSPAKTPEFTLWISAQILGLTGAVHTIHEPPNDFLGDPERKFGRHGDLKPENILYYPSANGGKAPGKLIITDFGLADVHRELSKSAVRKKGLGYTMSWAPPECDMKGNINALWDIWSLGCIFLEMACWMLGDDRKTGQERRKEFARARRQLDLFQVGTQQFYYIKPTGKEGEYGFGVKDGVVQCIEDMHKNPCCTQYLHELLDLVYNHMLVVRSPPKFDRIRSKALLTKVQSMHRKAQGPGGVAYLTEHRPWVNPCVQERPPVLDALYEELQAMVDESKKPLASGASHPMGDKNGSTGDSSDEAEPTSWYAQGRA